MENNYNIHSIEIENCVPSVNVFSDIKKVEQYIQKHPDQQNLIDQVLDYN